MAALKKITFTENPSIEVREEDTQDWVLAITYQHEPCETTD